MRVVDLYCGIGGFSTGAAQAGHVVALAVDADARVLATHARNHRRATHLQLRLGPHAGSAARLRAAIAAAVPRGAAYHLHASPPCQATSQANRRLSADAKRRGASLTEWTCELVEALAPTTWSLEQVATPLARAVLERQRALDPARVAYAVINCASFGVPQDRRRLIAGSPSLIAAFLARRSAPARSVRAALGATPTDHVMNRTTNTPDRRNGGHRPLRPEEHMRPVDRAAYTVLASKPMRWVDAEGVPLRSLTPEEEAALQTFPPGYDLGAWPRTVQQRGVGNAVPVEVARRLMLGAAASARRGRKCRGR